MNWELYKNFKAEEFACQHCGKEGIKEELLNKLQALRTFLNFSFVLGIILRHFRHPNSTGRYRTIELQKHDLENLFVD